MNMITQARGVIEKDIPYYLLRGNFVEAAIDWLNKREYTVSFSQFFDIHAGEHRWLVDGTPLDLTKKLGITASVGPGADLDEPFKHLLAELVVGVYYQQLGGHHA